CGWDGGNAIRPGLLDISRVNDWVGEKILFSPTRLARTYSPAERSAMLPSYFISAMMPMLVNPSAWRLRVDGLVRQPLELSVDDRHVACGARVGDHGLLPAAPLGQVHQLCVLRLGLFERLGSGERPAPADDPRLRNERPAADARARRSAAAILTDEAGIQTDE